MPDVALDPIVCWSSQSSSPSPLERVVSRGRRKSFATAEHSGSFYSSSCFLCGAAP